MKLKFTKMHGLGNDFVVVSSIDKPFRLLPQHITQMADRRVGVGFDQLLILEANTENDADFIYRIFNADGREVAQCGNGARCVAQFIKREGLSDQKEFRLKTLNGVLTTKLQGNGQVSVAMGIPNFSPNAIPFNCETHAKDYVLPLKDQSVRFSVVNLGNPHAVIAVNEIINSEVKKIGQQLSTHPSFPEGVNVGFMERLNSRHIKLKVYERGVGETLACGSGACAAMVIGVHQGLLDDAVKVSQAGGDLTVSWSGDASPVFLQGPAEFVYDGVIEFEG